MDQPLRRAALPGAVALVSLVATLAFVGPAAAVTSPPSAAGSIGSAWSTRVPSPPTGSRLGHQLGVWQSPSSLAVKALAFAQSHVDASGGAAVALNWTVTDTNPNAHEVAGTVTIRMQGTAPGTYLGRSYDISYLLGTSCCGGSATFVSGTVRESSYTFTFAVPQYANDTSATWVVTKVTIQDGVSPSASVTGDALKGFSGTLTATELVDTSAPILGPVTLASQIPAPRPYAYVNGTTALVIYGFTAQDWQSGFWKGSIRLTGPTGQSVTTPFEFEVPPGEPMGAKCGIDGGRDIHELACGIAITLPADATAGTWLVSAITLVNNAGVSATTENPDAPSVTVTSDAVVHASGFTANPNPANNYGTTATVKVSMAVSGAVSGVAAIYVDFDLDPGCSQITTTPTVNQDGTVSVPVWFHWGSASCTATGIAIVDGAGNVALYGSRYGAPDPHLTISQVPDTTPPTATAVTLNPTSLPSGQTSVTLTIQVAPSVAPVTSYEAYVYDSAGNVVGHVVGGTSQYPDGSVVLYPPVPPNLVAGTYTIGFSLTDAGNLTTRYGMPGGNPVPGGPLVLTVT